jgi:dipeptidyl aminopeptidase/acylaminoacyl peptidase
MRNLVTALAIALVTASASAADPSAVPGTDAAKRFGAREYIGQISLSPDGTKVAFISPAAERAAALMVADLVTGEAPKPILSASGQADRLTNCHWSSDTRLLTLNSNGSGVKVLSTGTHERSLDIMQEGGSVIDWTGPGNGGTVLMTRMHVPENSTGTNLANTRSGLDVDQVDVTSLARRVVESPRSGAVEYIADGHGQVRIMGVAARDGEGVDKGRITYLYRAKGRREWRPLSQIRFGAQGTTGSGFDPYAVDATLDVVYGFDDKDGRRALYRMPLDGSGKEELVFAHPDVDVDGLVRVGRQRRVVGVSYAVEQRETRFFDPELARLRAALAKALPDKPMMTFVDASADERKLLLFAGSDTDPGRYYLYDKNTRHLGEVLPVRPQLASVQLATVKAINFKAADGTTIPAYLTLPPGSTGKNLPAIVMPHGGPGDRDEWGFDWLSQFYANRGYAVLQPEFRGSSGYGQAWFQKNGFQSWQTAVHDIDDAGRYLQSAGIAAAGKLAIVGWSYGGYAALQSGVLEPDLFKAVVAIAPVTDLETLRNETRGFTNFALVDRFIGYGPHVRAGSPAQNAARIKAPVLIFHGDRDQNVGVGESRMMVSRLKSATKSVDYVEFKGLDHQLDDSNARAELLDRSDAFLRRSLAL